MAKKTSKKSGDDKTKQQAAADARRKWFTSDDLRGVISKIDAIQGKLKGVVNAMENSGTDSILVDGATKQKRAIDELKAFAINANTAAEKAE